MVDEFGNYTEKRKVKPKQWAGRFKILNSEEPVKEVNEPPARNLNKPGRFRQFTLYSFKGFEKQDIKHPVCSSDLA